MNDARKESVEIVKKYVDPFIALGHANCLYSDVCGDAAKAIESALLRAWNEGLEDAANRICSCNEPDRDLWEKCCELAERIRQLKKPLSSEKKL